MTSPDFLGWFVKLKYLFGDTASVAVAVVVTVVDLQSPQTFKYKSIQNICSLCNLAVCLRHIWIGLYLWTPKKVVPTPWPGIYWITGLCSCLYSGRHLHFIHFWFTFGHGNVFFNLFLLTKLTFLSKDTQYAHIIAYKVCIASLFYNVWPSFESILWPLVVTIWTTLKEHHLLALANSHTTAMYNIYIACKW